MKISTRLGLGFGMLLALMAVLTGMAMHGSDRYEQAVHELVHHRFPNTVHANEVIDRVNEIALAMATMLSPHANQPALRARLVSAREGIRERLDLLRGRVVSPRGVALLDALEHVRADYLAAQDRFLALLNDSEHGAARGYYHAALEPLQERYIAAALALIRHEDALITSKAADVDASRVALDRTMVATTGGALVLATLIAWGTIRRVNRPLLIAVNAADAIAAGRAPQFPARPPPDDFGKLLGALQMMAGTLAADLQRRQQAEQALRVREQLYRLLAEHSSDIICLHDAACRYTYVSPACERVLGWCAADLLMRTPAQLINPDDLNAIDPGHSSAFDAGGCYRVTFRVVTRSGVLRWMEVIGRRLEPGLAQDGNAIVSVMRDVTERREAEQRIRESELQLARSQQQAKLGSWWYRSPDSMLRWSDETYRIFGVAPGTRLDYAGFLACVHPDDRAAVDAAWQQALHEGSYELEHRIIAADGSIKWVRERAEVAHDSNGRPLGADGTVQDITDTKQKEQALIESRRLLQQLSAHREQDREDERRRIAREIHDELGQCLTALRLDAAMLSLRFGGVVPELVQLVNTMKQTIDQTLAVAREVTAALRPGILDQGLVPACEWLLTRFAVSSAVRTEFTAPDRELTPNEAIATAVFRILQESLTNVTRHAQARRVHVELRNEAGRLRLRVADDGIGFDPLSVARRGFGLLGIGERVDMLGGDLHIDGNAQPGTTLVVSLPMDPEPCG